MGSKILRKTGQLSAVTAVTLDELLVLLCRNSFWPYYRRVVLSHLALPFRVPGEQLRVIPWEDTVVVLFPLWCLCRRELQPVLASTHHLAEVRQWFPLLHSPGLE